MRVMFLGVALMGAYVVATTLFMAVLLFAGAREIFSPSHAPVPLTQKTE